MAAFDGKAFGEEIVGAVKTYMAAQLAPLIERIDVLETRSPEKGDPGENGKDGRDGIDGAPGRDGIDGKDGLPGKDGTAGLNGKDGEPGKDGRDGKDVDLAEVETKVLELVRRAVSEIPFPKDGKDGRDGKDADIEQVKGIVRDTVKQEVALIPPAQAGRDGQPGIPGRDGKDGVHGKDGRDGFSLEDLSVSSDDDGRTLILSFQRGEVVKKHELKTSVLLDRGVWKEGSYSKGDGVTWGGSFFIAQRDTDAKPETSTDWRLAVKRGRDGKEGKSGPIGPQGLRGEKGDSAPRSFGG